MSTVPASDVSDVQWIPSGIASLDAILGGGFPTRRITEISGPFSVGKSTVALTAIAQAQKLKFKTLWCDLEYSFERLYPVEVGVDLNKLLLMHERFAETAIDEIEAFADKNKNALIVVDAIGAMLPRAEAEKAAGEKVIGGQAGLVARFTRKIKPILDENNIALIVLNHEFTDIMSGRIMTSGGKKLEHAKDIWLKLRKAGKLIKSGENVLGEVITAEIRKNKVSNGMRKECELHLMYGKGFSKESDLMQSALDKGIFKKEGQMFLLDGVKVARGLNGLREALKDESLSAKVKSML